MSLPRDEIAASMNRLQSSESINISMNISDLYISIF